MAENKNTVVVYKDWLANFEDLSNEELGALMRHFFEYINDMEPELDDRLLKIAWKPIETTLKRDYKAYKSKISGKQRGANLTNLKRYAPAIHKKVISGDITLEEGLKLKEDNPKDQKKPKKDQKKSEPEKVFWSNDIIKAWNAAVESTSIPTIKTVTKKRKNRFEAIYKKFGSIVVSDVLMKAKNSDFLNGSNFFTFDWFFNENNFIKIQEGNYDNKKVDAQKNNRNRANEILKNLQDD